MRCENCDGCGQIEYCTVCRQIVDNCSCEGEEPFKSEMIDCNDCGGTGSIDDEDGDDEDGDDEGE
jgi:hypothetical protein